MLGTLHDKLCRTGFQHATTLEGTAIDCTSPYELRRNHRGHLSRH